MAHPDEPSDPERQFLTIDGRRLAYTSEGEGAHVIIAIHGLPGSARDWRWLAPALPASRLIRLDLPGFGKSERSGYTAMSVPERAEVVVAAMDQLDVEAPVLMTHSAGSFVAADLARSFPERASALALIASAGSRPHYPADFYRKLAGAFRFGPSRAVLNAIQRWAYPKLGFSRSLTDAERMYSSLDAAANDFEAQGRNMERLRIPTLLAWAEDDRMISREVFESLESDLPDGPRLRFSTGGHNIQKTRAFEVAEGIRELLDML